MVKNRCVNPYFHRLKYDNVYLIRIILGALLLVPLRLLLSLPLFFLASNLAKYYNHVLSKYDREKEENEFQRQRETYKKHIFYLFRSIMFICGFYKITIVQKGDPKKEDDAPIYVFAPHTSLFDVLAGIAFDAPSSVAKADILDIPLFGNVFRITDPVLVERNCKDSRANVFHQVERTIKFSKIVFFPEGTCSNHQALLQFKNGAFKFGYPVIPVALRFNQYDHPDTLSWTWDGPNTLLLILFTLARWRTDLELTKLPVYYPSEEEKNNPDLYAANVSQVLVDELRIPCLFYSFDDARYFKYKFFRSSTCVKLMKMCDKIRQALSKSSNNNGLSVPKLNGSSSSTSLKSLSANGSSNDLIRVPSASKMSSTTHFTEFLKDYIENTHVKLDSLDLKQPIDKPTLIDVLNAQSVPGIQSSSSLSELVICLEKVSVPCWYHLKGLLYLIDLEEDNLWDRLKGYYRVVQENEALSEENPMSFQTLKTLLWYTLNLEDVDLDEAIKSVRVVSFDDLKKLMINYYNFALVQNANSISITESFDL